MKKQFLLCTALVILLLISCKKENTDYRLQGIISNGDAGGPISGASVEVQKQVLDGGTFGATYTSAASGATDGGGGYSLQWPRENFGALKLIASKNDYITREVNLSVGDFESGNTVTQHLSIYPEAFIQVHIVNTADAAPTDEFLFTFTNAEFDCLCCSNGFKTFEGAVVDTTFQCKLYGNTWLKYQKQVITAAADTVINDSVWCPSFNTTQLYFSY